MEKPQTKADAVRNALTTATCSSTTVSTLRDLLNAQEPSKENVRPRPERKIGKATEYRNEQRARSVTRFSARTTSKPQSGTLVGVQEDEPRLILSANERYILAQEIVNISLKGLAEGLQPGSLHHPRIPPRDSHRKRKPSNGSTSRTSSSERSPLQLRQVNKLAKANNKRIDSRYSSSPTSQDVPASTIAIAECARVAFAHLRSFQADRSLKKALPALQLENGMLAFIGKLVNLGLHTLAIKELCILKGRLEDMMKGDICARELPGKEKNANHGMGAPKDQRTLVSLFVFNHISQENPALPLVVAHQMLVLRLISEAKEPSIMEAVLKYLETSSLSHPMHLILYTVNFGQPKEKVARQLQSLSQLFLSLCPSSSSSEDSAACNAKVHPTPQSAFVLQQMALESRIQWWSLVNHQADIGKELWEPFVKCLNAFANRSPTESKLVYETALDWSTKLEELLHNCNGGPKKGIRKQRSWTSLESSLSTIAQSAGNLQAAVDHARSALAISEEVGTTIECITLSLRLATLVLEGLAISDQRKAIEESDKSERTIDAAFKLIATRKDSSKISEISVILVSIMALRRAAVKFLLKSSREQGQTPVLGKIKVLKLSRAIIFESLHFLVNFMKSIPLDAAGASFPTDTLRYQALAAQVAKGTIDSVLGVLKPLVFAGDLSWEDLDGLLQDCVTCVSFVESWEKTSDRPFRLDFDPCQYLIKASNLYWTFQSRRSKLGNTSISGESIQALIRSVELLKPRSEPDQETGLLATKIEKLAAAFDLAGRSLEAHNALRDAIKLHIQWGSLREAATLAANNALRVVWTSNSQVSHLCRLLTAFTKRLKNKSRMNEDFESFFDDSNLTPPERGLLLEQQLHLISTSLEPRKTINSHTFIALRTIAQRLLAVYTASDFPIRRQRVSRNVLQLASDYPAIVDGEISSLTVHDYLTPEKQSLGADAGLRKFHAHIQASLRIAQNFYEGLPRFVTIQPALLDWQSILEGSPTWEDLLERIDDVEPFMSQLQAVASFLDMQGLDMQCVAVLSLISRIEALRTKSDPSAVFISRTRLAVQCLHLGYAGQAAINLTDARLLTSSSPLLPEASLRFQVAEAQYLLDIGDLEKCRETLDRISAFAAENSEIQKLSGPLASSDGRVRYNQFVADTLCVSSMLLLDSGRTDEALSQAKRSVKLYQRIWAILENRPSAKSYASAHDIPEPEIDSLAEDVAKVELDPGPRPPISSLTHKRLRGPAFWPFVSSLVRSLVHLARVYSHIGLFQESVYYSEQAEKIADAVQADAHLVTIRAGIIMCRASSHRDDEAQKMLDKIGQIQESSSNTQEMICYHRSKARLQQLRGEEEAELISIEQAISALEAVMSSQCGTTFNRPRSDVTSPESTSSKAQSNTSKKQKSTVKTPRRKPSPKPSTNPQIKAELHQSEDEVKYSSEFPRIAASLASLLARKAILLLLQGNLSKAGAILLRAQTLLTGREDAILHQMANFNNFLAQATQLLTSDFVYNVLPESTISFPATVGMEQGATETLPHHRDHMSLYEKGQIKSISPRKGGRRAIASKTDFTTLLQQARDCILDVHAKTFQVGSTFVLHRICDMLRHVTIFLSATSFKYPNVSFQPQAAAQYLESPRNHAFQSEVNAVAIDKRENKREGSLTWPEHTTSQNTAFLPTTYQFQRDYIDVIPDSWTAISISLNETEKDLYIARYHAHESPFIMRLPISRQKADDMDDDEPFTFGQGKKELLEIISLSNDSIHDSRDVSVKGAKTAWWAEREALDARMRDLLLNIENIWLGGFRGIFSQHQRYPHLLARFQKSFQNILDRHLPSRQSSSRRAGNTKGKNNSSGQHVDLDPRVLELFIGLGNATSESLDIDKALMDLMYFIVDILQFNGERNAYDEIDFDAIIVDTIDALKAYHEAASFEPAEKSPRHTILILDRQLHAFPWESLPCLDGLPVSRVPSMKVLRDRILLQRRQSEKRRSQDDSTSSTNDQRRQSFHSDRSKISYILNPSGDLLHTEKVLSGPLRTLPPNPACTIPCLIGRAPSEQEFESLLTQSDILLYFGHGSGAQYIRTRTVKRISRCASAVLLMGCSSGAVTENGDFEPHGSILGYLAAGWSNSDGLPRNIDENILESGGEGTEEANEEQTSPCMAVCGTLWDVTDKDIDRFSVRLGEEWGLWPTLAPETGSSAIDKVPKLTKTPGKRGRNRTDTQNDAGYDRRARNAQRQTGKSLVESVARSRGECYLRYLNGAAPVVYGVPVWLDG